MMPQTDVKLGRYQHFKGTIYRVITIARDTTTLENVVIYFNTSNPELVWARKETEFLSPKIVDGVKYVRFEFLGE